MTTHDIFPTRSLSINLIIVVPEPTLLKTLDARCRRISHKLNHLPEICKNLEAIWVTATMPDATLYMEYVEERALAPQQALKFVGCYANGPTKWNWNEFPFQKLGAVLNKALAPGSSITVTLKGFKNMWPPNMPCGRY